MCLVVARIFSDYDGYIGMEHASDPRTVNVKLILMLYHEEGNSAETLCVWRCVGGEAQNEVEVEVELNWEK